MAHYALEAADRVAEDGISVEVVDLRTLRPLDRDTLLDSVRKTGKCLVVYEDNKFGGYGAEVAAIVAEEAFDYLDGPVTRIAGPEVPGVPYNHALEDWFMVNPEKIADGDPDPCRVLTSARSSGRLRDDPRSPTAGGSSATKDGPDGLTLEVPGLEGKPWGYVAGTRLGKRYVSLYLMPVYAFPDLDEALSPELRRRKQGKSCFNFTPSTSRCSRSSPGSWRPGSSDTWRWPRRSRPPALSRPSQTVVGLPASFGSVARPNRPSRSSHRPSRPSHGHGCATCRASTRSRRQPERRPADRLARVPSRNDRGGRDRRDGRRTRDPRPRGLPHRPATHRALGDDHRRRDEQEQAPVRASACTVLVHVSPPRPDPADDPRAVCPC